jgi:hypothetical protein
VLSVNILLVSSQLLRGAALFKQSRLRHNWSTSLLRRHTQLFCWCWRGHWLSFAIRARWQIQCCFLAAARLQWLSRLRGLGDLHLVVRVCRFSIDVVGILMRLRLRLRLHLFVILFPSMWPTVHCSQQRWCSCCKPYSPRPRLAEHSHWEQPTTCSHRYCKQQRSKGASRQRTMPES